MSCATSHIWDCARWSPSCLILPRQPFFQPLDRIIAVLEFRIAHQLLVQRNGSLHPLDHIFLQRAPEAHPAALARTAIDDQLRSEEHTSELQSLMRISYAVLCLKKKNQHQIHTSILNTQTY